MLKKKDARKGVRAARITKGGTGDGKQNQAPCRLRPDGFRQDGACPLRSARALDGRDRLLRFDADLPPAWKIGTAKPTAEENGRRSAPSARLSRPGGNLQRRRLHGACRQGHPGTSPRAESARCSSAGTGPVCPRSAARNGRSPEKGRDEAVRQALEAELRSRRHRSRSTRGCSPLDPEAAAQIHPNNTKRVIRALEYCQAAGEPFFRAGPKQPTPRRRLMIT